MKTVGIFTTTRAEFGLLSAVIREIMDSGKLEYQLFVGGAHLSKETGRTIEEIYSTGFKITDTFDYLLNETNNITIAKSLGYATIEISNIFSKYNFDIVCVLGDRYELLAIVSNAIIYRKPIAHIHGGERTEGAIDEQVRHMITKASHIHFATCEEYAQNIINMGEAPWRVHNVGALVVDNIKKLKLLKKGDLFDYLKLNPDLPTVLLTYHPVTLELNLSPLKQIENLFSALKNKSYQIVITSPNVDHNREEIDKYIRDVCKINHNYKYFDSLGAINYLSLVQYCQIVIGNSSSGVIEVPYFKIPTINIGSRQQGRIMHESVINCDYSVQDIINAIDKALDGHFRGSLEEMEYHFGDGHASSKIVEILSRTEMDDNFLKKQLVFSNE